MKRVAVLGGGGTGCMMAADQKSKGNYVALYENAACDWSNLRDIQEEGGIRLTGNAATGVFTPDCITSDLEQAVAGADVILIAVIATRHQALCRELAPRLKDGQCVCFSAGNCGSLILHRMLPEDRDVVVGEMQENIYPCRIVGKAHVHSAFPHMTKKVAVFPGRDTPRLIEAMAEVYPCAPAKNILEATLNSPNVSIHLAGSLLNACAVEKNPDFRLYKEGISPAVITCIRQVEREKQEVMDQLNLECAHHVGMMVKLMAYDQFPELDDFRMVAGPSSMTHRYIEEDASTGQALLISLAHGLGITLPCMEALETLASVVNGKEYLSMGRTAEYLGFAGLSPDELNRFLQEG